MISGSWSHSRHVSLASRLCLIRLSAAQCLLLKASHKKIFTLIGAQVFQIKELPGKGVEPACSILQADLAVYSPVGVHFQIKRYVISSLKITSETLSQTCKYSVIAGTDRPPVFLVIQVALRSHWCTVCVLITLLETALIKVGAMLLTLMPSIQLSVQNKVLLPSPTITEIEAWKNACTRGST